MHFRSDKLLGSKVSKTFDRNSELNQDLKNKIVKDYNMDKFSSGRSKSIAYLQKPAQGNLNMYLKSTRMNHVNRAS